MTPLLNQLSPKFQVQLSNPIVTHIIESPPKVANVVSYVDDPILKQAETIAP